VCSISPGFPPDFYVLRLRPPRSTLFPYTTLFRSSTRKRSRIVMPGVTTRKPLVNLLLFGLLIAFIVCQAISIAMTVVLPAPVARSEEHTSELQSRFDLVCRLLLEKKKNKHTEWRM